MVSTDSIHQTMPQTNVLNLPAYDKENSQKSQLNLIIFLNRFKIHTPTYIINDILQHSRPTLALETN